MKRFPFFKQFDSMDCGPACLQMVAHYYGRFYRLETLREYSHITRQGVSLLDITHAAESIALSCHSFKCGWTELCNQISFPCIVHWEGNHFVVVYAIDLPTKRGKEPIVRVADPAFGRISYKKQDFMKKWQIAINNPEGIVLTLQPTEEFYSSSSEKRSFLNFKNLFSYLTPYRKAMIFLVLLMLLGSILNLIFPFLTQAIVDVGIVDTNIHFILILFLAQLMLSIGQVGGELFSNFFMLHVANRIGISFISDFLKKLMQLPISFFDVKKVGDILQRINDNNRILSFLTGSLISITVATITFIVYGIVMSTYSFLLLGIFVLGSLLYITWVIIFLQKRRELDFQRFQIASLNQSNLIQLVSGMQEIKLNNCEKQKRWEWERIQVKLFEISNKALILGQTQQIGGVFINQIKNIIISFIAANSVVNGSMTLGMMMAIQYVLGQLNSPLAQFISFIRDAQDARMSLERLGEIYNKPDEEPVGQFKINKIPSPSDIVLKNVSFRYGGSDSKWVLRNINLTIEAGKVTAIVGASGSGKTTLIKLLLGFYLPSHGNILLGNQSLNSFSPKAWRAKCGVVMQEGFIFSDTIAHNIGVMDDIPNLNRVKYAANIANLDQFIAQLPLGIDTKIGAEGNGLSSGQRQRILIARAVYKNPAYIFLDEATNALDATNEKSIMEHLQKFYYGKTVVIVAHRLSTVKNADHILVLEHGQIIEQGHHQQLINRQGAYYRLIRDQLELGN